MRYAEPAALFAGTAEEYSDFRFGHPAVLVDFIDSLRPAGTILDLGCGPGSVALALAKRGRDVIGLDASEEMLTAARAAAARSQTRGRVCWRRGDAHDLGGLPPVAGVTIGDAFHWFDRPAVLAELDRIVVRGGFVAVLMSFSAGTAKPWWYSLVDRVIYRHLGEERRAGPRAMYQPQPGGDHEAVLRASAFNRVTVVRTDLTVRMGLEQVIGNQYTQAYSSRLVLGERFDAFDRELRALLCAAEPSGVYTTVVQPGLIVARRGEEA